MGLELWTVPLNPSRNLALTLVLTGKRQSAKCFFNFSLTNQPCILGRMICQHALLMNASCLYVVCFYPSGFVCQDPLLRQLRLDRTGQEPSLKCQTQRAQVGTALNSTQIMKYKRYFKFSLYT